MNAAKNNIKPPIYSLNCSGKLLTLDIPRIMGIINVTPDSFYQGSRKSNMDEILEQAERMINEGADILDIGGQSTRPGSTRIGVQEEADRVIPAIEAIHKRFPGTIISVDTYYADVARNAVKAGASIINDISGGSMDMDMIATVASMKVPYICMHLKGTPDTMQQQAQYENVTREVLDYFIRKTDELKKAGIIDIIADPGFGFGKTAEQNFKLLSELEVFHILKRPLLVGMSRKATIYKTLGITADEALNGTTVMNTIALMKGAHFLRVHDVRQAKESATLINAMRSASAP